MNLARGTRINIVVILALPMIFVQLSCRDKQQIHGGIDPQTNQTVRQLSERMSGFNSFYVEAKASVQISDRRGDSKIDSTYVFTIERPNKCVVLIEDEKMPATIVCDGQSLYTYLPSMNKYTEEPAPETLDDMYNAGKALAMGGVSFVMVLFLNNPYEQIMDGVNEGKYLGVEEFDGVKCHHVKCFQEMFNWEMWVQAGEKPVVKKIFVTPSDAQAGNQGAGTGQAKIEMTITLNKWILDADLSADTFKFTVPAGAEKVASFFENLDEGQLQSLVGKVAPQFKLDLLDGSQLDLSKHKGQHVVILDFWASWCGPCIQALPILERVAREYEKKDVVLYAVDLQEQPDTVRAFLKSKKLSLNVALDRDGRVGNLYGIQGIPQTVIIAKDGTVRKIHSGMESNMEAVLKKELDALLAGNPLSDIE